VEDGNSDQQRAKSPPETHHDETEARSRHNVKDVCDLREMYCISDAINTYTGTVGTRTQYFYDINLLLKIIHSKIHVYIYIYTVHIFKNEAMGKNMDVRDCKRIAVIAARGIPVINDFFLAHVENGTYRTERKMRFSRLKISMLVPNPTMTENKQHCL
jgi:hypothetical protein